MEDFKTLKETRTAIANTQQHDAADPRYSIWVEASAGTGKTKVLTDRVLRLLLSGVEPQRLLCLTYTKAAAVEMRSRISQKLSEWAVQDELKLAQNLQELLGAEIQNPSNRQKYFAKARILFAELLDTPGGIKVQTIHSFCTDILKRFPLEAGVSPYFRVLEDEETLAALAQIKSEITQTENYLNNQDLSLACSYLIANLKETTFDLLLQNIINNQRQMAEILENHHNLSGFLNALSAKLGIKDTDTVESLCAEFMATVRTKSAEVKANIIALSHGEKTNCQAAKELAGVVERNFIVADYQAYKSVFLTQKNITKSAKTLASNAAKSFDPDLLERLIKEGNRLEEFEQKLLKQKLYQSTKAAFTIAQEISNRYADFKRANSCLDFADLVHYTRDLLKDSSARQWVLYKLDGGIDHILLDEAQDTSPEQWDIVASLSEEFFNGEGQRENNRTLFVVGDRKQSIYSFQGADPHKFDTMSKMFEQKAKSAQKDFKRVNLEVSFRSAPAILDVVNKIFATPEAADGVVIENKKINHQAFRVGQFGKVTILPQLEPQEGENTHTDNEYMQPPTERVYKTALVTKMAEDTARRIRQMIAESQHTSRPLHYRDIMVLVRHRNDFVEEFIRACEKEQVSISGADKIVLSKQIAVQDLISLGKFLLFPQDSLSLAEVLTSPLFAINPQVLEDLCYNRKSGEELWNALKKDSRCADICNQLTTLLNNLDYVRPYELYNFVLTSMCGRQKFIERMGSQVADILDEFINITLDYEQQNIPSLQGFIAWFGGSKKEIKRESDEAEIDAVRLLTVHHSKGLQAPIVFLPDCGTPPINKHSQALLKDNNLGYYPLNADYYDNTCMHLHEQNRAEAMREYRRLLYVALTRAEDQLYVCAYGKENAEAWYSLCKNAFADTNADKAQSIELCSPEYITKPEDKKPLTAQFAYPPAEWIKQNIEPEAELAKPYTPSHAESDENEDSSSPLQDNGRYYRRGTLIHRLLQFLPQNDGDKAKAVDMFLAKNAADFSTPQIAQIKSEVMSALQTPEFTDIFGALSKAEVPIMGEVDGKIISAQIDRLVVLPDKVKIVDFKTNRPPAQTVLQTPKEYINQLQNYAKLAARIYPQKSIETYILWTNENRLMRIS